MALMKGQRECVETFGVPMAVAAGAGSGKTFTLTQRIAHAFEVGAVDDIDEVLAITYTNKAATELKGRIKGALRQIGRVDQALKVDNAWISTIHGMCSRILSEHALELGIDPKFSLPDNDTYERIVEGVVNDAIRTVSAADPERADGLFAAYDAEKVRSMVHILLNQMLRDTRGAASFVLPCAGRSEDELVRQALLVVEELVEAASQEKASASRDTFLAAADDAMTLIAQELGPEAQGIDPLQLIAAIPEPTRKFGSKEYKSFATEAGEHLANIMLQARVAYAQRFLKLLVEIASLARELLDAEMASRGLLSTDDLIARCALAFEEHPEIAAQYTDRFKLLMVDEFQDTNQMQVDMVSRMAGAEGERLCVVGDAQQSIYRFQGADVSVYRRHVASVAAGGGKVIKLFDNFRSHDAILKFVDAVFERPAAFGGEFESLVARRDESKIARPFLSNAPRISVDFVNGHARTAGAAAEDVCAMQARAIANRFAEYKRAGHRAGDMVVLLGAMRNAQVYADALTAVGLPAVVVGGSVLKSMPETLAIRMLARALANPYDGEALLSALLSDIFAVPAEDALTLGRKSAPKQGKRPLWDGVRAVLDDSEAVSCTPATLCACRVFTAAQRRVGAERLSAVIADVLVDSGYLRRCEDAGDAGRSSAANALKLVRMLEDVEAREPVGVREVARRFEVETALASEAPGALSATGGDFVRIMTMHSSKGLQFPIVAVSELTKRRDDQATLVASDVAGMRFVALDMPKPPFEGLMDSKLYANCRKKAYASLLGDLDDAALRAAVAQRDDPALSLCAGIEIDHRANEEETKRLYYVALTRAMEALVVSVRGNVSQKDPEGKFEGVGDLVRGAIFGDDAAAERGEAVCRLSAGARDELARVRRFDLPMDADAIPAPAVEEHDAGVFVPSGPAVSRPARKPVHEQSKTLFSYSSLAAAHVDQSALWERLGITGDDAGAPATRKPRQVEGEDRATDFGTAFHLLAQYAMETRGDGLLAMPDAKRIDAVTHAHGISDEGRNRLATALSRWVESPVARTLCSMEQQACEVPFALSLPGVGAVLEGDIDLLGIGADADPLRIVDYKTGGADDESPSALAHKHALQAACYALAAMQWRQRPVELDFVRVEREDASGGPQVVHYRFEPEDAPLIAEFLAGACEEAKAAGTGVDMPVYNDDVWTVD